jgi:aldehyde dehydrogenase (NAD+)
MADDGGSGGSAGMKKSRSKLGAMKEAKASRSAKSFPFPDPVLKAPGIQNKSIAEIFEKLEYGPAPESAAVAMAWMDDHDRHFGHFINGEWVKPEGRKIYETSAPATGEVLCKTIQGTEEDVNLAVQSARTAYEMWGKLSPHERARHIYSLARHMQKHARLIAVVESLDNGKPIRETRDADVQVVIRHLYHYAGWAQLYDTEMRGWSSVGVVGGIVAWNFPLMLLVWKVAPALAMGNTVVMKPATYTRLSALLFAEICNEAGLPKGVFNVITGSGRMGSMLAGHADVDKVGFTGSTEIGQLLRRLTAGTGKKISLELGGKSPIIVFDSADLDATVEGIVDAIWFNQGQVCSAGSRLLVQENVYDRLQAKLKERMKKLRVGPSLDKGFDMGAVVDIKQRQDIEKYVQIAREEGCDVFQACACMPSDGLYYPPTLITNVQPVSTVVQEEIFGPVLAMYSFRTPKEALKLANQSRYGLAASVWTENMSLALECAVSLKAGTVWVNAHNLFDAAAGFGGYRESGFGRDGGKEGLYEYAKPSWMPRVRIEAGKDNGSFGKVVPGRPVNPARDPTPIFQRPGALALSAASTPTIDRTYKLFIGGKQCRPDATYVRPVKAVDGRVLGQVSDGNRKDIRNAVEAAHKAAAGWGKRAAHNRAQIVYFMAENLELRRAEFASQISSMTGGSMEEGLKEVDASIGRLFHWAAYADKYGGTVQETQLYGATVKINEPVGVIGIACPDACPLLGFVSLFAPAIVRGNTMVILPSEAHPLAALDLFQVFETSDLPAGVVNIVSGGRDHLTKTLSEHQDIEAMWYFGTAEGSRFVEAAAADNVKRTWVNYGMARDWHDDEQGQGEEFLYQSIESKNIWLPMGEIFAN